MRTRSGGDAKAAAGVLIFLVVHAALIFQLAAPMIEDPIGRAAEAKLLAGIDDRIRETRTGAFTVAFQDPTGAPLIGLKVDYRLVRHDFIFGCNLFGFGTFKDPEPARRYREDFKRLFNTAVLPFYWRSFEPREGELPTRPELEAMLAWCEANDITPKGHPLAWRNPAGYPDWLPPRPERVQALLHGRIEREVDFFRDRIKIWDVVNEPTHLPPFFGTSTLDYVRDAFAWAHARDPQALLCLNDYGLEGHDFGRGPYARLLERLLEAGAPVGVIGIQGREPRASWIPMPRLQKTLDGYARFGLPLHVTELTAPSSSDLPIINSWKRGVWTPEAQADYLERYYKVCFAHPAVAGVIYWDLYDGQAWIKEGGLIAADFRPKLAYQRLDRLINQDWRTIGGATTGPHGAISFRGFYGRYALELPDRGTSFLLETKRGGEKKFVFTVTAPGKEKN